MSNPQRVINFIKNVYEFFRTDYFYVMDFLNEDTPWDRDFTYKFGISKADLDILKYDMRRSIEVTYRQNVLTWINERHQLPLVDEKFVRELQNGKDVWTILNENRECNVIAHRMFLNGVSVNTPIKVDTYNDFEENIMTIIDIFGTIFEKYNGPEIYSSDPDSEEAQFIFEQVYKEAYPTIAKYFQVSFRSIEEETRFINYLFSLAYAFLYYEKDKEEGLDSAEVAVMGILEDDINARDVFYSNAFIACTVIDIIFSLYQSYGRAYDLRRSIKDDKVQTMFGNLDKNYNNQFSEPIMIYDFSIDTKLEECLALLEEDHTELFDLLTTHESIYDILMDNDLDGRFEDYFKLLMIGKILGDVFEVESYNHSNNENAKRYRELLDVARSKDLSFPYFFDNAGYLLDTYFNYHHADEDYIRHVRLSVKDNQDIPYVLKLNQVGIGHYLDLCKDMPSVDYINHMLALSKESNFLMILHSIPKDEQDKLIHSMCLNVYEHLVLEKKKSKEMEEVISMIENDAIVTSLIDDEEKLMRIVRLFKFYNDAKLSYNVEHRMRSKIQDTDHVKVLERLNPFSSEEKEQ